MKPSAAGLGHDGRASTVRADLRFSADLFSRPLHVFHPPRDAELSSINGDIAQGPTHMSKMVV